jgi:signal transduction histidine kinase
VLVEFGRRALTPVRDTAVVVAQPRSARNRVADVALALLAGLFLVLVVLGRPQQPDSWLTLLLAVAGVAQGLALLWRWSHPRLVMAIAVAGGLPIQLYAPDTLFPVAALVALYALTATGRPALSLPALAVTLGLTAIGFEALSAGDVGFGMAIAVGVWALGEAARNRLRAIEEGSRRAVGEEQARIARELHDVIAHSVSVIVVQAAAADDVFDERPDQARAALRSIEASGREALGELRRLLSRVAPADGDDPPPPPQPGLRRLDELVAPLRAAGLAVELHGDTGAVDVASGIDLSAYRIVQEALTNTLRHAAATRADVTIRSTGEALELDVVDDGRGTDAARVGGAGRGIAGMRERATLLGGTLEAGPLPGGGFRVRARLPLERR